LRKQTLPPPADHSHWMAGLFFVSLILLFYWKVIFGHSIFVFVDASRFFYPLWKWGADVLKQGTIPLWNPDAQFGTPYFADPQMAYAYPPVIFFYSLLNPVNAFAALIILHHLWALLGFWFFARGQGFSGKASIIGSLIFGFSLHVVCSSWTPVALMTISWVPWVFASAEKVFQGKGGGLFFLSFTWAMQLAAGYPVLTYLTGLALGLHYSWKTWWHNDSFHHHLLSFVLGPQKPRGIHKPGMEPSSQKVDWIGWFGLAAALAAAYNAVWGLPFIEFFKQSNYQKGASHFHELNWQDLATAFSPFVQGHPLLSNYHGPHYWVSTYFIGLPALCLILWGGMRLVYEKTSWGIFPLLLVLTCGGLGIGEALKAILPGYTLVIHSGFWISLLLLWAAWLAMESAEGFLTAPRNRILTWLFPAVLVYGISFFIARPQVPEVFWASLLLLAAAVFFQSAGTRWLFLLTALGLSLGTSASSLNILLDRSYYEAPPNLLPRLSQGGRLFFSPPLMGEAARLQGESMSQAYDMAKQKLYPNWPLAYGLEEAPLYNTFQLSDSFAWTFQAFQISLDHSRELLDYLNIRYVFGKSEFHDLKQIQGPDSLVPVSENPNPLPKWYSVGKALPGASLQDVFARAEGNPIDYRKECYIADPSKAGSYELRQVSGIRPFSNGVEMEAQGKGKALIISSETDYPGWKARVVNEEKPVEQINHSFRGIVLNEGETHVFFKYEPLTFRVGLFISLLACGLWTGLLLKTQGGKN
jgi:hypothetical protein